jgi:hypothetical protein
MLSSVTFVPLSPIGDELFAKRSGHAPRTNEYMDAMHSMASIIKFVWAKLAGVITVSDLDFGGL